MQATLCPTQINLTLTQVMNECQVDIEDDSHHQHYFSQRKVEKKKGMIRRIFLDLRDIEWGMLVFTVLLVNWHGSRLGSDGWLTEEGWQYIILESMLGKGMYGDGWILRECGRVVGGVLTLPTHLCLNVR